MGAGDRSKSAAISWGVSMVLWPGVEKIKGSSLSDEEGPC